MNRLRLLFNRQTWLSTRNLSTFALICISAVSLVYLSVSDRIAQQITNATLAQFREIAPKLTLTPSLLEQVETIYLAGHDVEHYQVINDGHVDVDFFKATTSKGYSGNITLLIGISADRQTLLGVRVLTHHETPGLGDKIDSRISPWIYHFSNRNIGRTHFAVRKEGGDFDAFTGATITPRAVTELVGDISRTWQQQGQ